VFDHYGFDEVSIMPADAYTSICQCPLCRGLDTPERGNRGRLSDHVWGFVNRVAAEIAKTHPDKKVNCLAYGSYWLPPLKIDKLHPNVRVGIVAGRRPREDRPDEQKRITENREAWIEKTGNKVFIFENYPMRGNYRPWFVPHVNAATINATKDHSIGESIWTTMRGRNAEPGFYHFAVYFTARMYWGGKDADIDPMLSEYFRLFYGPAEKEMKAFFEYSEAHWREVDKEKEKFDRLFELFAAAERKVNPKSLYGKRIAVMADFLKKLKSKGPMIEKALAREGVPELRLAESDAPVKIDGKLDDTFWRDVPESARGDLKDLVSGGPPRHKTTVMAAWRGEDLYIGFRCSDSGDLNVGSETNEDPAVWYGDVVEILLETDKNRYYQIAIGPTGALADMDRSRGRVFLWDSLAEVATKIDGNGWTAEIRFPIVGDSDDPNHQVVGTKPTKARPWFLNLCRQRIRGKGESQLSAFSPTGKPVFHVVEKFARMYVE
jgi:hypothetical protein